MKTKLPVLLFLFFCLFIITNKNDSFAQYPKTIFEIEKDKNYKIKFPRHNKEFTAALVSDFSGKKNILGFNSQPLTVFRNDTIVFQFDYLIRDYCWLPDRNILVYMTMEDITEAGYGAPAREIYAFYADSLKNKLVYSISKNQNIYIINAEYIQFDNSVYLRNMGRDTLQVLKLDIENKKLLPTEFKGLRFSPDGKYYTNYSYEGSAIILYDSKTNTPFWNDDFAYKKKWIEITKWEISDSEYYVFLLSFHELTKVNCLTREIEQVYKRPNFVVKPIIQKDTVLWK